jgi:hypothetical protein
MKRFIIAVTGLLIAMPVVAAEGRWTEGTGQGNLEYFIDKQGFTLYIGCPTQDGSADAYSSVSLNRKNDFSSISSFKILVNGLEFDGPFEANSRVGTNNFLELLNSLRKSDATVKFSGKTITFPKSNASKVIPVSGKKGFECNLG